jgi:MFS family permease
LLFTLSMAQFVVVLDFTIVNVALPSIQHGLHVATTTLQWLVSGYAVAFRGFSLLGGRLADVYGRARPSVLAKAQVNPSIEYSSGTGSSATIGSGVMIQLSPAAKPPRPSTSP